MYYSRKNAPLIPEDAVPPFDDPDENLGERTLKRTAIIASLEEVLDDKSVPVAFWACLQVCDMEVLDDLSRDCWRAPNLANKLFIPFMKSCHSLPRIWMPKSARFPKYKYRTSAPEYPNSVTLSESSRPEVIEARTAERDGNGCVLSRSGPFQIAHIFPRHLLDAMNTITREQSLPTIWEQLSMFWLEEQVDRWYDQIEVDEDNITEIVDGVSNRICLRNDLHQA